MAAELEEIRDFLAEHPPFDALTSGELDALPRRLQVTYFRRGTLIREAGEPDVELLIVRSGAIEVHDDDRLIRRCGVGEAAGISPLRHEGPDARTSLRLTAYEDTVALVMPGAVFADLAARLPQFRLHFLEHEAVRLQQAVQTLQTPRTGGTVLRTRVGDLVHRPPIDVGPRQSIRDAAELMSRESVSSLLVAQEGRLLGIVTDRDLRNRVLASGRSPDDPVESVMSAELFTVGADALAFELMLQMVGRAVHHAPVMDGGRVLGVVTSTDLVRLERTNPVYLVGDIGRRDSVASLVEAGRLTPEVVASLVDQDASADDIGRMVSAIGDAIERRLLELAERDLGPPPVPYCWITLGSRARQEQVLGSDQDHGLILAGDHAATSDPEVERWFATLSERMVDALEAAGYPRCPGDVMASNPTWRQPVDGWLAHVEGWMQRPSPTAILNSAIFFDMRAVHGDASLHERVAEHVREQAPGADNFLLHLAGLVVRQPPPLGFFRGFVLEKDGEHRDTLDLKAGGVHSVVGLGRLHALAHRIRAVNTRDRLAASVAAGAMSGDLAADLADAFEFICYVRLQHQARQVAEGVPPDNFVAPSALSGFDRQTLRDAFEVVRHAQRAVAHRYPVRLVS